MLVQEESLAPSPIVTSLLGSWPLAVIVIISAFTAGIIIWALVSQNIPSILLQNYFCSFFLSCSSTVFCALTMTLFLNSLTFLILKF